MGELAALAVLSRQDGLITDAQALARGFTARTLRRRVPDGGWRRVAPGVLLAGGHPLTDRARVRAAGLWVGDRGVLSGPAAAWWHGMLPAAPARIELTVARSCGLRGRPGTVIRRRDLDLLDVASVDGVDLTAGPLTALETAAVLRDGSMFLDRALQKRVHFPAVYRAYCRNLGAQGGARVAELLTAAADRADSAAERRLVAILRAAEVRGWQRALPFGPWTIDIAFPDLKLAIEVDGWAWHMEVANADRICTQLVIMGKEGVRRGRPVRPSPRSRSRPPLPGRGDLPRPSSWRASGGRRR